MIMPDSYKTLSLTMLSALLLLTGCVRHGSDAESSRRLAHVDSLISARNSGARAAIELCMRDAEDSLSWYEAYVRMAKYYALSSTPDSQLPILDKVDRYVSHAGNGDRVLELKAFALNSRAAYFHNFHNNPQEVIDLYRRAYDLLMRCDNKKMTPNVMANLGDAYAFVNDLPQAAASFRRAMFLADSLGMPEDVTLGMGLAGIYQQLGDNDKALKLFQESEKQIGTMSVSMQAYLLNNFGNYYYYNHDYRSALTKFLAMKRLLEKHGMEANFDMYLCKVNLADVYLNLDSLDKAAAYLDEVEPFMKEHGDKVAQYYCNTIRIGIAVKHRRWDDVVRHNATDNSYDIPFSMRDIRTHYLRQYYIAKGNYRQAYEDFFAHSQYTDSLEHNRTNMRATDIMAQFTADTLRLHADLQREYQHAKVVRNGIIAAIAVGAACLLALLLLVLALRSHKERLEARMRIMDLRLLSARGKISPHFIFNVLNNHIITSESDSDGTLLNLTKLIRHNLDMSRSLIVPLQDELDFLRQYVDAERPMVGSDFDFQINVAQDIDTTQTRIPSMLVQVTVENAIVHALSGWKGHKMLHIDVERMTKAISITVTDNGPGFDPSVLSNSKRTGLNIIRETIAVINSRNRQQMTFGVSNVTGEEQKVKGCRAVLTIPENLKL